MKYDFSGWATKNNIRCSDGRTIMPDAFKDNDGTIVPLVWNHDHNSPNNVLGHALLENRPEGVYAYCQLNDTQAGRDVKALVNHGDVDALSIYANKLKQNGGNVVHGAIREVSVVLAGANPGAYIDTVITHSEDGSDSEEGIIFSGDINLSIAAEEEEHVEHAEAPSEPRETKEDTVATENTTVTKSDDELTVQDVIDTMDDKQKTVMYALVGEAYDSGVEDAKNGTVKTANGETETNTEDAEMKHNVFDTDIENDEDFLTHADLDAVFSDAKRYGSLKDSTLAHGITNIDYLFSDAQNVDDMPRYIKRNDDWVATVMNGVHHTPFSRIKSIFADITEEDARAKGYIKGKEKKEEVFTLLKRTTTPTTIYKKQKLDRDDVVDITDFDVVAMIKAEMRMMLDEEIGRAILVGDGRSSSSDDKINETNIRPIWTDEDLYTIKTKIDVDSSTATDSDKAKAFIKAAIKSRKNYKGSGNPVLYTTEDVLTDCLLLEDTTGRIIYDSVDKLATTLRVSKIVTVPVMENLTRTSGTDSLQLMGIIVNLSDYNVGADKGGAINMFDDFDIDYNAQKYLIETRCSGALVVPYSAIAIEAPVAQG